VLLDARPEGSLVHSAERQVVGPVGEGTKRCNTDAGSVLIAILRTESSPVQALSNRKVQPVGAADPQALGGDVNAGDDLRIEA
jgi:hypothetical protein